MSITDLSKMFVSESEGWWDYIQMRPSVMKLYVFLVIPLSLIPAVMYAYSYLTYPGVLTPVIAPVLTSRELFFGGAIFFVVELAMVSLMAGYIQQIGNSFDCAPAYREAMMLAAVAPTPLWISSLALFIPSLGANVIAVAIAWFASAILIRHGVRPIFKLSDPELGHRIATAVTIAGVLAWMLLMLMFALILSLVLGTHRVI